MRKNDFWAKISSFGFFYRWHPEVALRYMPLVRQLKSIKGEYTLLEVGSAGLGIAPYINHSITGVDKQFFPPFHNSLKRVVADATELPFSNSSFDIVLSIDMLEHLESTKRYQAIKEMLRVAKKKLFIGVPCGEAAHKQDIILDKYYKEKFGKKYHFLEEQEIYGLPDKKDINDTIVKASEDLGRKVKIKSVGNENLTLHMFLMKGWMTKNILKDILFRKILLLLIPIMSRLNNNPTYRQIFFIDILK